MADDFYYILSAAQITITTLSVTSTNGTGSIVLNSGILRISYFSSYANISNVYFSNCIQQYSKGILVESGIAFIIKNTTYSNSIIDYAPLIYGSNLYSIVMDTMLINNISKSIVDQNYIIQLNLLTLSSGNSYYTIKNLIFTNSSASLLAINSIT